MEALGPTAPDLENGFLVLGAKSDNGWATEILCAVREISPAGERWYYLSKECRSEDVPLKRGGNAKTIFQTERSWEFTMAVFDDRAVQLTSSDISVRSEEARSLEGTKDEFPEAALMSEDFVAEVHCRERDVRAMPVAEALERLRGRRLPVRNLFMRVAWRHGEGGCDLYCPCRYVNFGTLVEEGNDYVQPISGYVMVPHPEAGIQVGYVACALAADGRKILEFCGKRYRNVFLWAAERIDAEGGSPELARNLAQSFPISTTVFDQVMVIDGSCQLFEYR